MSTATHRPVILTAAIVGAEITRAQTPHLPITAEEIAEEADRCRNAGAAIIHLHVRTQDGAPSQSAELFIEAVGAIRARTDVIIQVSTGGAVGMSAEQRLEALACKPEMATLNCGTMNFGDDIFVNTWPMMRSFAKAITEKKIVPELEVYDLGHLALAKKLVNEGEVEAPAHVQFVLGVPGGAPADEPTLRFMVSQLPASWSWSVAAVGRHQQPMTELALAMGGHARVGLEDNIYLSKGVLSEGSAPLVERLAAAAHKVGRTPLEPRDAIKMIHRAST